jgi:hypothetical protein
MVGDEGSFPLIVDAIDQHGHEVILALKRLTNRGPTAEGTFREWREKTTEKTRAEWVRSGFAAVGIEIGKEPTPKDLPILVGALEDQRHWIRFNAARMLRERTGLAMGWQAFWWPHDSPKYQAQRRTAVARWRRWLDERK